MNETPTIAEPTGTGPQPEGAGPSTAAPPPPYPPVYARVPRPPLRRSRTDRVLGGVCGGIGRHYDVDPTLLRILTVVLTIFTGGGFAIAYLVGWIFIENEPELLPAALPGGPGSWPPPGSYPPPVAPQPAGTGYAAGGTGVYVDPGSGAVAGSYGPPAPPAPREPRSYLGLVAVSLAVLVGGVLALVEVAGADLPDAVIPASMLLVLGLGLLVGAVRGRARWLIAPAALLLVITQAAALVPSLSTATSGGVGQRRWTPTVSAPAPFDLGIGEARLDLGRLPAGPATVTAHVGLGHLLVTVPPDTTVHLHGTVGAGDITVPGQPDQSGTSLRTDTTIDAVTGTPTTTVDLTADIGLGQLEVRRATS